MVLLSLSAVRKAFGTNEVIRDATLALQEGERLGLVGVNGSGKTTLLKIINGDMPSDGGEISIAKDARIGFLTQHADIDGELSIMEELTRVFDPLIAMEKRLRARGTESEESLNIRLHNAAREVEQAYRYDYIVIHEDWDEVPDALDRAIEQVYDIIQAARAKTKHNMRFLNALTASLKAGK